MNELQLQMEQNRHRDEARGIQLRTEQVEREKGFLNRLKKLGGHIDIIKIRF